MPLVTDSAVPLLFGQKADLQRSLLWPYVCMTLVRSGISCDCEQKFIPTKLGGNEQLFASQVLRSPGRVERLCTAQVVAGHGYFVWLNLMGMQLQHSRCWAPEGGQDWCDKHRCRISAC